VAFRVEAGTGSTFLTCEVTAIERLICWLMVFKLEAGTGSTFLTCEVAEVERLICW